MKILTHADTLHWLDSHRIPYNPHNNVNEGFVYAPDNNHSLIMKAPADARRNLLFAHELARWLPEAEALLWITNWDTGPSDEYEYFASWRHTQGESRPLIEAPGYIFRLGKDNDRWFLSEVLSKLMAFTWQGFVVHPSGPDIIWLADEIVEISLHDSAARGYIASRLKRLGIEKATRT